MERQYIGARYVPKFFENPQTGDSAWLSGVSYEPLTIVTWAGNSYTSKKVVPASVGSPNTNPAYWVSTGIYNAQVQEIMEEVDALNGRVTTAEGNISSAQTDIDNIQDDLSPILNKKYIFISDSYGNYTNAGGNNFIQTACSMLGITAYHDFHRGSAGFTRSGELNFLRVLTDNESVITNKSEITDIFVFGSANDQLATSASDIEAGISTFCSYAKTNYPNATIHIGALSKTYEGIYIAKLRQTIRAYSYCGEYGATYLSGSEDIMTWNYLFRTDHVHPTEMAVDVIAKYVADLIKSGSCTVLYDTIIASNFTADAGNYSLTIANDYSSLSFAKGVSILSGRNGGALFNLACSIPSLTSGLSLTVKLRNCYNPPVQDNMNAGPAFAIVTAGGSQKIVNMSFSMKRDPNSDGSYNCTLIFYPTSALSNVTAILPLANIAMN